MANLPRTSFVLKQLGITQSESRWLKPQYARSGRYIHAGADALAQGYKLTDPWFDVWFKRTTDGGPGDIVVHEDCRPKLNGYAKFQRDHKPKLIATFPVTEPGLVHPVYGYACHPDQLVELPIDIGFRHETDPYLTLIELKSGLEMNWHELQIASYLLAVEHHYRRRPRTIALYLEPDDYRLVPLSDPWRAKQKWIALMAAWNVIVEYKSTLTHPAFSEVPDGNNTAVS